MIALITARSGSKTLPGKNVKLLAGKPLLCWSIESALAAGLDPVVSSDSQSYLDLAERYGARGLLRPESLAQDGTPHFDVIVHAVQALGNPTEMVLMQPTCPFRRTEDVRQAIDVFMKNDLDSMIHVVPVPEEYHPDVTLQMVDGKVVMASGIPVKYRIKRRQDHRPAWVPSGGLYCFKTRNLMYGNFYGDRCGVFEVAETVNINDQADWTKAELIAKTWRQD